jgi:AraC family transcriptional regulator
MQTTIDRTSYEERLSRVTAYIYDHLDDEMDLQKLAEVACLSPYHWHRIYHAMYGETIAATVKRLRLHRAAGYLAQTTMTIDDIATRCGYGNLQSFTRTFGEVYGMPPAQYRRAGSHTQFQTQLPTRGPVMHDLSIKTVSSLQAIAVEQLGSYMQIGKAFDTLYGWLGARNLLGADMRSIGLYFDDPTAVPEAELRARACVVIAALPKLEAPLQRTEIAGGNYAVLRHKGPYADMKAAYQWLFGEWLPQSGQEAADAPVFEEYLNSPRDTAPADLRSDIYLPLR